MEPNAYESEQVVTNKQLTWRSKKKKPFYWNDTTQQLFAKLKQEERTCFLPLKEEEENEAKDCSSEEEHKVNALASRADEGRDNLR